MVNYPSLTLCYAFPSNTQAWCRPHGAAKRPTLTTATSRPPTSWAPAVSSPLVPGAPAQGSGRARRRGRGSQDASIWMGDGGAWVRALCGDTSEEVLGPTAKQSGVSPANCLMRGTKGTTVYPGSVQLVTTTCRATLTCGNSLGQGTNTWVGAAVQWCRGGSWSREPQWQVPGTGTLGIDVGKPGMRAGWCHCHL